MKICNNHIEIGINILTFFILKVILYSLIHTIINHYTVKRAKYACICNLVKENGSNDFDEMYYVHRY